MNNSVFSLQVFPNVRKFLLLFSMLWALCCTYKYVPHTRKCKCTTTISTTTYQHVCCSITPKSWENALALLLLSLVVVVIMFLVCTRYLSLYPFSKVGSIKLHCTYVCVVYGCMCAA